MSIAFLAVPACLTPTPQEFQTGALTRGQVWRGVVEVAQSNGYPSNASTTDQGLGIYESRWRTRIDSMMHAERRRLRIELVPLEDEDAGWQVRYYVEQQRVGDLARSREPLDEDWSSDGQDATAEEYIGAALRMRLGVPIHQSGVRDPDIR